MKDQTHKLAMVQTIHQLQLDRGLVEALDDAQQAEAIVHAVDTLLAFTEQWN